MRSALKLHSCSYNIDCESVTDVGCDIHNQFFNDLTWEWLAESDPESFNELVYLVLADEDEFEEEAEYGD